MLYAEYFNPKSGTPQNQLLIRRHHQSEEEGASSTTDQRQIWHTPTELFKSCQSIVLDPGGTEGMIKSDEECWILGMEVLDNLARDVIRYDRVTCTPLQSIVITDHNGDFHERFIPITLHNNPTLLKYLSIFNNHLPYSKIRSKIQEILATYIPFRSNLTPPEFVPTNYMNLLTTIFNCFPNHKIILSDFNSLPNSLPGSKGAPVVQTRYNGLA
ncbi:hypothetical protein H4Q26_012349 [Puccinia striiformis f. sp. tritici PST-130]|nr:hypothetical protein H4Q26_012349 [Puccinia striiformis f. sp. tritici PST-130]